MSTAGTTTQTAPAATAAASSLMSNPRSAAACAADLHSSYKPDSDGTGALRSLYRYYFCKNDTQYMQIFDQMRDSLVARKHQDLPVLACIISAYCLFILSGAFGNGLVMLIVCRNRAMRTARNLFIFNLAVSDFILCLFTQPLNILRLFPDYISWELGTPLCKMVNMLTGLNMFVSTFSITAIALDRFQVIVYPSRTRMDKRTMALCLAAIWGAASMMASPLALFANTVENHLSASSVAMKSCSEITTRIFVRYAKIAYSSGVMVVQYMVPLGIVIAAYARICVRLRHRMLSMRQRYGGGGPVRSSQQQQQQQQPVSCYQAARQALEATRQRRANRLLVTIAVVFSLSWLPLTIVNIVHDFRLLKIKEQFDRGGSASGGGSGGSGLGGGGLSKADTSLAVAVSQSIPLLLVLVSACLNPIFYGWFNENFQAEFHRLLCLNRIARAGPKFRASGGSGQQQQQQQQQQPVDEADNSAASVTSMQQPGGASGIPLMVLQPTTASTIMEAAIVHGE